MGGRKEFFRPPQGDMDALWFAWYEVLVLNFKYL